MSTWRALPDDSIYTVSRQKKTSPFYICHNLGRCHPIMPFFRNILQEIWNKSHIHGPPHLVVYVRTVPCKN